MLDDRWDLLVNAILDESHRFWRESFSESRVALREVVQSGSNETADLLLNPFFGDELLKPLLNKMQNLIQCVVTQCGVNSSLQELIHSGIDEASDSSGCFFALEHRHDVISQPVLQSRNGVKNRCTRARGQRVDEGRITRAQ